MAASFGRSARQARWMHPRKSTVPPRKAWWLRVVPLRPYFGDAVRCAAGRLDEMAFSSCGGHGRFQKKKVPIFLSFVDFSEHKIYVCDHQQAQRIKVGLTRSI
jgi:hypothetical protein